MVGMRNWSKKQWAGVVVGGIVFAGVVNGVLNPDPPQNAPAAQPTAAVASAAQGAAPAATTVPPAPEPTATPAPEPVVLSGSGKAVRDVTLARGLARLTMKHAGQGHFAVTMLTADGQRASVAGAASETLLANTAGAAWEGEKAVRVERAGPFVLDISADGAWEIAIVQ